MIGGWTTASLRQGRPLNPTPGRYKDSQSATNGAVLAPTNFPRNDLVAAFLTGISGLNQPKNVRPSEMLRLNTSIVPKPKG